MTNCRISTEAGTPLSADTAFVVHVTTLEEDAPGVVEGRIEHINSGRSLRFASVAELLRFMRQVLAAGPESRAPGSC
ncbi:MAG TPA: hypothetical protein VEB21_02490 [Terriglobales bacterium]|nr:hypothetical protein [Terriglobales bacterium]